MMATLTPPGRGSAGSVCGVVAVVSQKFCSWMGIIISANDEAL
jgi:hypothetical protein